MLGCSRHHHLSLNCEASRILRGTSLADLATQRTANLSTVREYPHQRRTGFRATVKKRKISLGIPCARLNDDGRISSHKIMVWEVGGS